MEAFRRNSATIACPKCRRHLGDVILVDDYRLAIIDGRYAESVDFVGLDYTARCRCGGELAISSARYHIGVRLAA